MTRASTKPPSACLTRAQGIDLTQSPRVRERKKTPPATRQLPEESIMISSMITERNVLSRSACLHAMPSLLAGSCRPCPQPPRASSPHSRGVIQLRCAKCERQRRRHRPQDSWKQRAHTSRTSPLRNEGTRRTVHVTVNEEHAHGQESRGRTGQTRWKKKKSKRKRLLRMCSVPCCTLRARAVRARVQHWKWKEEM